MAATRATRAKRGRRAVESGAPRRRRKKSKPPKLSRQHKPADMSLEEWQTGLRRQFGREQKFRLTNAGVDPVFSEFQVANPQSGRTYGVTVRGPHPGDNH